MIVRFFPSFLLGILGTWFGVKKLPGVEYVKALFPFYLALLVVATFVPPGFISVSLLNADPPQTPGPLRAGILAGLILCTVADFLLGKRENQNVFMYGLAGFLLAYLTYGLTFFLYGGISKTFLVASIVLCTTGVIQFITLKNLPKELRVPVIFYIGVVSFFVASAIAYDSIRVLAGALLIYLSDSLIAHNLYRSPIQKSDLYILPPYYVGQILITVSVLI